MKRLAIFASGEGTNAQQIIDHFRESDIKIALIVCNKPLANVLNRAKNHNIPSLLVNKELFYNSEAVLKKLQEEKIDLIICAGFLWKVPDNIIRAFPNRIINIHPALLPKFGGKGMYGMNVHKAVIGSGTKESGITIHYVNEHYDEGKIILQASCEVTSNDTPETLAQKVHRLEHRYFPETIEKILKQNP
ncbi:MAG TPA: phosphoribosylglycinamide formyltransferase [Bacteroidia bacterium]